jgi:hypothetical protein
MEALLVGTKERLEELLAARFPQVASLSSGSYRVPAGKSGETTTRMRPDTLPGLEPAPEDPPAVPRPRWLLPVILVLTALLATLLWITARS